jgi:hypothetical protein
MGLSKNIELFVEGCTALLIVWQIFPARSAETAERLWKRPDSFSRLKKVRCRWAVPTDGCRGWCPWYL